jgi:hypothetical protein
MARTKEPKSVEIIDLSDSDGADELNIKNPADTSEDESEEELHATAATLATPPPTVSKKRKRGEPGK